MLKIYMDLVIPALQEHSNVKYELYTFKYSIQMLFTAIHVVVAAIVFLAKSLPWHASHRLPYKSTNSYRTGPRP